MSESNNRPRHFVISAKAGIHQDISASRIYSVYILASKRHGTLYIGVTANLAARMVAHRNGTGSSFTRKYRVTTLVHVEQYHDIRDAIAREKALKKWKRSWKLRLIEEGNPGWDDLFDRINV